MVIWLRMTKLVSRLYGLHSIGLSTYLCPVKELEGGGGGKGGIELAKNRTRTLKNRIVRADDVKNINITISR